MIFQYLPDMCCMCLLQGLKGHIRVIYLTSRLPPIGELLASKAAPYPPPPDAHWPPLEAWYLGYGWIGQQPSSGLLDRPRGVLGVFASSDRLWTLQLMAHSPLLWLKSKTKSFGFYEVASH
jgi:hypothetical protein